MEENIITQKVLSLAYEVHTKLGPGLLESAYQACLLYELKANGFLVKCELAMPIIYKEIKLDHGY